MGRRDVLPQDWVPATVADDSLVGALGEGYPEGLGVIPAVRLTCSEEQLPREVSRLFGIVQQDGMAGKSPARQVLDNRRGRAVSWTSPEFSLLPMATLLSRLSTRRESPSVAGCNLRSCPLGANDPSRAIVDLLGDFVQGGLAEGLVPSALASVVWGAELSSATGDPQYSDLIIQAADRFQAVSPGVAPPPCDPDFRTEDMFMAGALLGRAFELTGQLRYVDVLAQFILDGDIQQDNGLYWHCRSAPFYWGRGNGFALMGLTETLTYLCRRTTPAAPT